MESRIAPEFRDTAGSDTGEGRCGEGEEFWEKIAPGLETLETLDPDEEVGGLGGFKHASKAASGEFGRNLQAVEMLPQEAEFSEVGGKESDVTGCDGAQMAGFAVCDLNPG